MPKAKYWNGSTWVLLDDKVSSSVRFTIGTSTKGWTVKNCDYLCDGTDDQAEINSAITALPSTGGEIVILDGTYNITDGISISKSNVILRGNGNSTILKRMYDGVSPSDALITIETGLSYCKIQDLYVNGNKDGGYTSYSNSGIKVLAGSNHNITGTTCNNNSKIGINFLSDKGLISNNITNANFYGGIVVCGLKNIVSYNASNNSLYEAGIYLFYTNNDATFNKVIGNTCETNTMGIKLAMVQQVTISNNSCTTNGTGIHSEGDKISISGNQCNLNTGYGIRVDSHAENLLTGNICNNNTYHGIEFSMSEGCVATGNTCNNNGYFGIELDGSEYCTVSSNKCKSNTRNGINVGGMSAYGANHSIIGNYCNLNVMDGINIDTSHNTSITGNTCYDNGLIGIHILEGNKNLISDNVCSRGYGTPEDYSATQYTIRIESYGNANNNIVSSNQCMGKDIVVSDGTGNSVFNNKWDSTDISFIATPTQIGYLSSVIGGIQSSVLGFGAGTGYNSIVEGEGTIASSDLDHAEGGYTTASGGYSHAEGGNTTASGHASHAEGGSTNATNEASHAEGISTIASGYGSHSQNYNTTARGYAQTAIGMYNIEQGDNNSFVDTDQAFIIGNGLDMFNRSNALTIDWAGNVNIPTGATYNVNGIPIAADINGASWTLVNSYTDAGSYTWTAPDYFNGTSYEVAAYIIGGGGGGVAAKKVASVTTAVSSYGIGGASGYSRATPISIVSPTNTVSIVVGGKGIGGSTSSTNTNAAGTTGGTSSFGTITAPGGESGTAANNKIGANGGQGSSASQDFFGNSTYSTTGNGVTAPAFGDRQYDVSVYDATYLNVYWKQGKSQPQQNFINPFDYNQYGIAGGIGFAYTKNNTTFTVNFEASPYDFGGILKGGNGAGSATGISIKAEDATSPGAGGGGAGFAVYSASANTCTAGNGANGAVFVYVRKRSIL